MNFGCGSVAQRSGNTAILFAYIPRGRKPLTLLDSQPCPVAKSFAMDVSAVERPARGLAFGRVPPAISRSRFGSAAIVLSMTMFSIALNIVHVYTHP